MLGADNSTKKLSLGMPVSHIRVPAQVLATLLPTQLPADTPGKQQIMAQELESLPSMQEMQTECQAPGFSLEHPGHVLALGE